MNLFDLFVRIVVDTGDVEKKLPTVTDKVGRLADGLKTGLVTAAKASAVAVGAAATAFGALGNVALENYAEYEQLVGGVETLFGTGGKSIEAYAESVGKSVDAARAEYNRLTLAQVDVVKNAENAFQTAGMSSNEYMNTVTSFSASLIQGLDGDTTAAARIADRAITDMSDNANKMGTDITMIQNAYQGFAKQNYTMLDNLKLGYGGTQAEMARLINDSGVLGESMTVTDKTVNQVSFDKIIEAIGVVQDRMGITGTTATEAASTIQGSIGMMKAAWQNFLTGMVDPSQNIGTLIGNVVNSVVTVADNLVPAINDMIPRLAEGLAQVSTGLMPHAISLMETLLPGLVQGASSMIESFTAVLPEIITSAMETLPELVDAAVTIVENLTNALIDNLSLIVEAATTIIFTLANALIVMTPELIRRAPEIVMSILEGINNAFPSIYEAGKNLIEGLWQGIASMGKWLLDKVGWFFGGIVDDVKDLLGIHSPSTVFAGIGENMALGLGEGWDSEYNRIKRQIDGGLQFGTASVDFASSGLGMASAGIVNGVGSAVSGGADMGGVTTVNLVMGDGTKLASWQLPYLIKTAAANGTPIASGQMA